MFYGKYSSFLELFIFQSVFILSTSQFLCLFSLLVILAFSTKLNFTKGTLIFYFKQPEHFFTTKFTLLNWRQEDCVLWNISMNYELCMTVTHPYISGLSTEY